MSSIHDVMHDVFAVTCVVCMRSGAWTACCAVLSWLLTAWMLDYIIQFTSLFLFPVYMYYLYTFNYYLKCKNFIVIIYPVKQKEALHCRI